MVNGLVLVALLFVGAHSYHNHVEEGHHDYGYCPSHGGWKHLEHLCYREGPGKKEFRGAIHTCLDDNFDNGPYIQMINVGSLRNFVNRYDNFEEEHLVEEQEITHTHGHYHGDFRHEHEHTHYEHHHHYAHFRDNNGPFRVNAIKGVDHKWREYPSGYEIDFHHFPDFHAHRGNPGDTLIWLPLQDELRVADPYKDYSVLCYRPKLGVCRHCRSSEYFLHECFDSGYCVEGECICDRSFKGTYCEVPPPPQRKVLFTVGVTASSDNNAEIFDFETGQACHVREYPIDQANKQVGNFVNGEVVVCGGTNAVSGYPIKSCYGFNQKDQVWEPVQDMREYRVSADGVLLHNQHTWWVTGGSFLGPGGDTGTQYKILQQTEIFTPDRYWARGPDLPHPVRRHCAVQINDCETAIVGGSLDSSDLNDNGYRRIDVYDWNTETWRVGPSTVEAHEYTWCGVITDPDSMHPIVVIAGEDSDDLELWDTVSNTVSVVADILPSTGDTFSVTEVSKFEVAITSNTQDKVYLYSITEGLIEAGEFAESRTTGYQLSFLVPRDYFKCLADIL